ncbi:MULTISPECIES: DUF3567 domain-containing protein [Zoogloea]|jgi:hypothetical protein|uniref:DUF3567 domain-containing protein n=1 Tax=Zoogloea oleivorans TaxID=1552750 RepID=A0A6C2CQ22_9RHOO|nr:MULTISPECIES: DUF3567 domain-containing protein [Zoogloea]MBT9499126.1 hypothetical protein [Zoogloea sp.]MDD2669225.1 hypothetical protein [Zoogloea sp.]MDY0035085.1 hypothetical protein [Zoogloea oleivorans]TYC56217.1 hypothetical protein ETQ85_13030 [Zoogloea oleivorans]
MNVVLNNPVLYVVDYPNVDAVEVIDKRRGVGVLFRDEAAQRFLRELRDVASAATEMDDFEIWIADYGTLMTQPAVYH